jgi:hypothetical protein
MKNIIILFKQLFTASGEVYTLYGESGGIRTRVIYVTLPMSYSRPQMSYSRPKWTIPASDELFAHSVSYSLAWAIPVLDEPIPASDDLFPLWWAIRTLNTQWAIPSHELFLSSMSLFLPLMIYSPSDELFPLSWNKIVHELFLCMYVYLLCPWAYKQLVWNSFDMKNKITRYTGFA